MMKNHKRKLDMLEPGAKMCKAIFILLVVGIALNYFRLEKAGVVMLIAAGLIFIVLLVLLVIEQHQDYEQYLEAKRNDPDIK